MATIEKIDEYIVYENPLPQLRSSCGKFPGLVQLDSGELIALFELGQAFESVDSRTVLSRSTDNGATWQLQGDLYDSEQSGFDFPISECLKPTLLKDKTLIAAGYRFHRPDPELPLGNPKTMGLLSGNNVVCFSKDNGYSWSIPKVIEFDFPEVLETSGSAIELASGDLILSGPAFKMWDGSNPTGQSGILLRSKDQGHSWDSTTRYFVDPLGKITPWETRICQMQPGRLVAIVWAYDIEANKHFTNHITISHDDGFTWSKPIDVGLTGHASNLMWLGDDMLLTIHAHRIAPDTGLYVRLVDFKNDKWKTIEETCIWGKAKSQNKSNNIIKQFANLKFGQPSLITLQNGDILATFWCVEDCLYKIKTTKLKLNL